MENVRSQNKVELKKRLYTGLKNTEIQKIQKYKNTKIQKYRNTKIQINNITVVLGIPVQLTLVLVFDLDNLLSMEMLSKFQKHIDQKKFILTMFKKQKECLIEADQ